MTWNAKDGAVLRGRVMKIAGGRVRVQREDDETSTWLEFRELNTSCEAENEDPATVDQIARAVKDAFTTATECLARV